MTELFLRTGLSNALLSLVLALLAGAVGLTFKRPQLTHLLWLLVFVKLVTPPLVHLPLVTIPSPAGLSSTRYVLSPSTGAIATGESTRSAASIQALTPSSTHGRTSSIGRWWASTHTRLTSWGARWLLPVWLVGGFLVFAGSLFRAYRFNRLLVRESVEAPSSIQDTAASISHHLGLRRVPTVYTTTACLSPMVWWMGGPVRVVLPLHLLRHMVPEQWRWVLAHELAHVQRRDYMVRWLEWLACVGFWWNPVVWWAQRNLRATEEICCDALVLSALKPSPHSYAKALLGAVEFLAGAMIRPPAMASEINSGGFLERRFKMMISRKTLRPTAVWIQVCVLFGALIVLPFGVVRAQDYEAVSQRLGQAVENGELTPEQARTMMTALKKNAARAQRGKAARQVDHDALGKKLKAAVQAGRLTEEDAARKWAAAQKKSNTRAGGEKSTSKTTPRKHPEDPGTWIASVGEDLRAAVEAGKITEKEAWAKWHKVKDQQIAPRLKAAVESGKMTEEQAMGIWHEIEKSEAGAKLKAAVKAGKMSEADARVKWDEINRTGTKKEPAPSNQKELETWIETTGNRIKAAAEAGEITGEEAWAKWFAFKENDVAPKLRATVEAGIMNKEEARAIWHRLELAELGERLRGAVEAGEISAEEARAKWHEMTGEEPVSQP